jgi:hypothetical protein
LADSGCFATMNSHAWLNTKSEKDPSYAWERKLHFPVETENQKVKDGEVGISPEVRDLSRLYVLNDE